VIENVGVGLYPSLMGTFSILSLILVIGYSSTVVDKEAHVRVIQSFKKKYFDDPWVLPNPSDSRDD